MLECHIQKEQAFNLIFGYNGVYHERVDSTTTSVGNNRWDGATVPSDELWVVTAMQGMNVTTAASIIHCGKVSGGAEYMVKDTRYYTPTREIDWQGKLVVGPGENAYILWGACLANDRRIGHIIGYKMKLEQ